MPDLEYIVMHRCQVNYATARELVLHSRETLGMNKFDPWTDDLEAAVYRLFEMRHGPLPPMPMTTPPKDHSSKMHYDSESTLTPKTTLSISSCEESPSHEEEDEPHHHHRTSSRKPTPHMVDLRQQVIVEDLEDHDDSPRKLQQPGNKHKKKGIFALFRKGIRIDLSKK